MSEKRSKHEQAVVARLNIQWSDEYDLMTTRRPFYHWLEGKYAELDEENSWLRKNLKEAGAMLDYYLYFLHEGEELAWGLLSKERRDWYRRQVNIDSIVCGIGMVKEDE